MDDTEAGALYRPTGLYFGELLAVRNAGTGCGYNARWVGYCIDCCSCRLGLLISLLLL